jgi:Na+-transporting methylmalonyl-CoA/oxaloacetate decarboxylase gamma subunit
MWDKLSESLVVMLVGISAVFASLFFFYIIIMILQFIDNKLNSIRVQKKLTPLINEEKNDLKLSPEIVAVISAAVYEVIKKPIVVKKIKYLSQTETSWSETGRMIVMGSHNIIKK